MRNSDDLRFLVRIRKLLRGVNRCWTQCAVRWINKFQSKPEAGPGKSPANHGYTHQSSVAGASKDSAIATQYQTTAYAQDNARKDDHPSKDYLGRAVAYAVICNSVAAMVLAVYGIRQSHSMERATEMAEQSVKLTVANARLDQRAWVGVTEIDGSPVVANPLAVTVKLQNTGKTPALNVRTTIVIQDFKKGGEPVFNWSRKNGTDTDDVSVSIMPPNGVGAVSGSLPENHPENVVTESDLNGWKSGDRVLFVSCHVTYDDIFGVHHWLTCCDVMHSDLRFAGYRKNNTTDDNGVKP